MIISRTENAFQLSQYSSPHSAEGLTRKGIFGAQGRRNEEGNQEEEAVPITITYGYSRDHRAERTAMDVGASDHP